MPGHNFVLIDEPERRGFQIWTNDPVAKYDSNMEPIADDDGNPILEPQMVLESVVTNPANFLSIEETVGNAQDAVTQFDEQEQMRIAAEAGLESEKSDPKWGEDAGAE